jgi:hypothetical protein
VALTSTRNLWLGSWLLANGLVFVRATRLAGPHFRVNFFFDDPNNDAPQLTRQYLENIAMQRLITSRRVMGDILDVVERRGQCEANDIGDRLAAVARPWRTDRTSPNLGMCRRNDEREEQGPCSPTFSPGAEARR